MKNQWIIEAYLTDDGLLQRIPLASMPVRVGRDASHGLPIVRSEVSRNHAEFFEQDGMLMLRDLGSTNGSFVNRQKVDQPIRLQHGDVIHFASYEARLIEDVDLSATDPANMTVMNAMPMGNKLPEGLPQVQKIVDERGIQAVFQAIVNSDGTLYGYEVLGRGALDNVPSHPMQLFRIAESWPHMAASLSETMRDCGVEQAVQQSPSTRLFVNTHPEELKNLPQLLKSVEALRNSFPNTPLVLEIHEDAIANADALLQLTKALQALDIELAFDDFGAGQARLMELVDVPVAYVKFDIALIRGLPDAPESKRKMVAALAAMTKAMGIKALAEGVETEAELALCQQMGFDLIQGYYFSKPKQTMDYQAP